ncbi:MAG: hypothetical protein ABEH81_14940, partial [Halopenitus sp.]
RANAVSEPGEERSEQRDRLSGWGFLGMLSGVAGDDHHPNHGQSDRLSGWGFLGVLSGVASDNVRSTEEARSLSACPFLYVSSGVASDDSRLRL